MHLSYQQVTYLIALAITTKEDAIGCDECSDLMHRYAQAIMDGTKVKEPIHVVSGHIEQCNCCRDEFEAFMTGLWEVLHPTSNSRPTNLNAANNQETFLTYRNPDIRDGRS